MEVTEGSVTVEVPEARRGSSEGTGDGVFYNPDQELNRDVTVATLGAWRARIGVEGPLSYLDAMSASGIRGARAAAAGYRVTCCDVDADAVDLAERNLARNGLDGTCVRRDANAFMHESRYGFDVVDLDPFGTPIPFADAAVRSARGLVCVTATDTAPLCGAHFDSGVRTYGAVPRNTEFHPEMGLRVLVSALVRTAARYDVAARPVLSHVSNHYVRTYLALDRGATAANEALDELGHVDWCPDCLWRAHERGLLADPTGACPNCGTSTATAGPLWLGPAHDAAFVRATRERVRDDMGTATRADRLLDRIASELHEPTHYDQHRLFATWGEPATGMEEFLDALRVAGHEASRTHFGGTTFKTTAGVEDIREAALAD